MKIIPIQKNITHNKPRIAYLSSDFHDHATMHLMAGVFEKIKALKNLIIMLFPTLERQIILK